jgi:hypothetical protein
VVYVNPIINLTCQYNVSWVRDYTSNIGINYTISQGIPWANVSFTLRNSTGDVIAKIENYTNENGSFNLLYTLPADLPLGTYIIHGYANRTGYGLKPTKILTTQFSIISNISVSKIDPAIQVVQGETKEFNITFSSTRNNAMWVKYNGTGTGLNLSEQTFLLANNNVTSHLMNITAGLDALVGSHDVVLTLVNDSITLFAYLLTIEVLPAVTFEYVEYAQKIVAGFDGQMYIMLENARPSAQETVNVILSGEDLEAITLPVTLQGQEKVKVYVPLNFTGTFNKGALNFQVNLTRYTQILASNTYTTELVPAIEVQSFSTSTEIVQGRDFYINFQAINNKNVTQPVQLYININGQLTQVEINLLPGQNNIIVPRSPLTVNPWDFGTYTIDITVKVGGSAIYQDRLSVTAMTSVENVLFCYVLPIAIPIAAILIFIQRQKKRELLR